MFMKVMTIILCILYFVGSILLAVVGLITAGWTAVIFGALSIVLGAYGCLFTYLSLNEL